MRPDRRGLWSRDHGFAVVVALMALLIISAAAAALVLATSTESLIARNFRDGVSARYAADAIVARGLADLAGEPDWTSVLDGSARSSFFDAGAAWRDGSMVDLAALVNLSNCGQAAFCTDAAMDRTTVERPWGANNPRWRVYACGRAADLLGAVGAASREFVLVLVADDPLETDGNPVMDGGGATNPGKDVLLLRGEAFAPGGAHGLVEVTIAREAGAPGGSAVRVLSWRLGT